MSVKISVVCEDHTLDQFLVRPIFQAVLKEVGKPTARVAVVTDPRLRGIDDLWARACAILARYGPISDAVVFAIDADRKDGRDGRSDRSARLRDLLAQCERCPEKALVVAGIQEIEVWALWGSRDELGASWSAVRSEQHPKEVYFDRLTDQDDLRSPGKGRQRLVERSLASGWASLTEGCPELRTLQDSLRNLTSFKH